MRSVGNTAKGYMKWLAQYSAVLYLDLIACADIFSLTFTIASLYSLIIEQFQHKIWFSSSNEAAWSHLALAKTYLLWWFYSFVLLYFLLLSTFPLYSIDSALESLWQAISLMTEQHCPLLVENENTLTQHGHRDNMHAETTRLHFVVLQLFIVYSWSLPLSSHPL